MTPGAKVEYMYGAAFVPTDLPTQDVKIRIAGVEPWAIEYLPHAVDENMFVAEITTINATASLVKPAQLNSPNNPFQISGTYWENTNTSEGFALVEGILDHSQIPGVQFRSLSVIADGVTIYTENFPPIKAQLGLKQHFQVIIYSE